MKMNRGIAKRALGLGLAIVMALSVTACGKKQSGEPGAAGGQQEQSGGQQTQAAGGEKIVNVGVTDTLNTLNPLLMDGGEINKYATGLMFLPLMELDSDLKFEGMLADSITAEDEHNFLVHIDEKATWSDGKPVTAGQIGAAGAMTALLKDALDPNLVQTLENNPAIIHGGPFANIAHGCNSVLATKLSLSLADYTITEAGFGADLGAEKFLDIKCRYAGIAPSACVLVATVRALKSHGGVAKADLSQPNLEAVKAGAANLIRHIDNLKNGFGLPVVVAINAFPTDTPEEQAYVEQVCAEQGVPCVLSEVFAKGGEGGKALAEKVLEVMEDRPIQYTYPLDMPLKDKINAIATKIYRADGVNYSAAASKTLAELTEMGYGDLPVCIAKTQYSFSDNAKLTGAPTGFTMEVREVRLAAGAGFVVVICGSIMTMPGLPKKPAAVGIDVDADGKITGLF